MKKFIFFTMNDFSKSGGGTIRMLGMMNALASRGHQVICYSGAVNHDLFDQTIIHQNILFKITKFQKKLLQFSIAVFPFFVIHLLFFKLFKQMQKQCGNISTDTDHFICCEYVDVSIGYLLTKQGILSKFTADIHGIAPLEFAHKTSEKRVYQIVNLIKAKIAFMHDNKVFAQADELIFVSNAMKDYFMDIYPFRKGRKYFIVRDGISQALCRQTVNMQLLDDLKNRYKIHQTDKVVLFAGNFKDLGGVLDLIDAFAIVNQTHRDMKLFLIGDGETLKSSIQKVAEYALNERICFAGRIPYGDLRTYQELADVIVCPDKQHPYSDMVPHIKYFDSLISNKIVINGKFPSVQELNSHDVLSLSFVPSDVKDLAKTIIYALEHQVYLMERYKQNHEFVCNNMTYDRHVKELENE